jgi:hypothetical protein
MKSFSTVFNAGSGSIVRWPTGHLAYRQVASQPMPRRRLHWDIVGPRAAGSCVSSQDGCAEDCASLRLFPTCQRIGSEAAPTDRMVGREWFRGNHFPTPTIVKGFPFRSIAAPIGELPPNLRCQSPWLMTITVKMTYVWNPMPQICWIGQTYRLRARATSATHPTTRRRRQPRFHDRFGSQVAVRVDQSVAGEQ